MHICPPTTREYVSVSFCDFARKDVDEHTGEGRLLHYRSFFLLKNKTSFSLFHFSFFRLHDLRSIGQLMTVAKARLLSLPVRMRIMMIVMRKRIKYHHRLFAACTSPRSLNWRDICLVCPSYFAFCE